MDKELVGGGMCRIEALLWRANAVSSPWAAVRCQSCHACPKMGASGRESGERDQQVERVPRPPRAPCNLRAEEDVLKQPSALMEPPCRGRGAPILCCCGHVRGEPRNKLLYSLKQLFSPLL